MKIAKLFTLLLFILLALACKKTEVECTCYHTTRKACENEKSCEWAIVATHYNHHNQNNTYSIVTTESCECKDNTVYEPLLDKKIVLTSDLGSPQSLGSITDNEFTFAVIKTKGEDTPVLVSSATTNIIEGKNRSSTITYFDYIGINTDTYNFAKTSKNVANIRVGKTMENTIVELRIGAVIIFESGNGIKGIIKVNDTDLNTNPQTLEIMVKYYDSHEQFELPQNKGFTKTIRNITITTDPNNSSFFNLANLDNELTDAELCFASVPSNGMYSILTSVIISPTSRNNYFGLSSNGTVTTLFTRINEPFENTYAINPNHTTANRDEITIGQIEDRPIFFTSSNGKSGLIKI